jgi:predicted GIY-YIG superfamily endonuclease
LAKTAVVNQVVQNAKGGVYGLLDKAVNAFVRTGRTKDLAKREAQHQTAKETKDLKFVELHRTDDYAAQRGLEHIEHGKHNSTAGKENGGLNKIKAMSDQKLNSPQGKSYLDAAKKFLGIN